jgi:2-octaprenylphenol hydroxylase
VDRFDVLIVGGGMVGTTLACALKHSGMKIGLIEAQSPADIRADDPVDLRVSAITRASQQVFTALGAWPGMAARRISPFREMHVWDAGGEGRIHFDAAELGEDALGHIIENAVVQQALWETLQAGGGVELLCPASVSSLRRDEDGICCHLQDGRELRARLLVGADGAQSRVRHFARVQARGWPYDQQALVATVVTEHSHRETAWQRFLPNGPLAFLPLHDGRSSIVWSTTPQQAKQLLAEDDETFCRQLELAFAATLGRIESCGERAAFPLRLQYVDTYVQPGLALIGDAAHTVHPLAGQGVNLGILDAASLAEVLLEARAQGKDIAALKVLRRYERWRKGHNLMMMATMDGFKRLFGATWEPLRWMRNAGLNLTNVLPPVKQLIMNHAMGRSGDLPVLARPASQEQFSAL